MKTEAGSEIDINDPSPLIQLRRHHEWQMEHAAEYTYINSHLYILTVKALATEEPTNATEVA
jgi:hypothetical protein